MHYVTNFFLLEAKRVTWPFHLSLRHRTVVSLVLQECRDWWTEWFSAPRTMACKHWNGNSGSCSNAMGPTLLAACLCCSRCACAGMLYYFSWGLNGKRVFYPTVEIGEDVPRWMGQWKCAGRVAPVGAGK